MILIKELVTVRIYYFIPDQLNLINEFWWQTNDMVPTLPRIRKFVAFWIKELDAPIKMIETSYSWRGKIRNTTFEGKLDGLSS